MIKKQNKYSYLIVSSFLISFLLGAMVVYLWDKNILREEKQRYDASVRIYDVVVSCLVNGNCDFEKAEKKVINIIGSDKTLYHDFILKTTPHIE